MFNDSLLSLHSYNFETILSEKLQTILHRGLLNSRSKDFYDTYIIYKLRINNIDKNTLAKAFNKTCQYRNTVFTKEEAFAIVAQLNESKNLQTRWMAYKKKNYYVGDISFKDTISAINKFLNIIYNH